MSNLRKIRGEFTQRSSGEMTADERLKELSEINRDAFGAQWNHHSTVFLKRQVLSRLIYQDTLYRKIINVPGVICEFGVQWGATMTTLINLRGMYEPYNHSRTIHGFDTFEGFANINAKDGTASAAGDYATSKGYEAELEEILSLQESFSPLSHMKKFELIRGDVTETLPPWIKANPHVIISMAIFDMDVYEPTVAAIVGVLPRLTRGSLLVFDELNCRHFPGETQAVIEELGLGKLRLERFEHQPFCAFAVLEG
jgi:Macrocin-O-methyltransferase (TylF)